jgi:hypothetical protein
MIPKGGRRFSEKIMLKSETPTRDRTAAVASGGEIEMKRPPS